MALVSAFPVPVADAFHVYQVNTLFPRGSSEYLILGMRTTTENGPEVDLDRVLDDIKVLVHDGQELLKSKAVLAKERALVGAKATDRAVRENPYQTLGILFGAGLIIGLLCSNAFSSSRRDPDLQEEE